MIDEQHSRFLRQRHFGSLDGLRCISILAVIWAHGPGQGVSWVLLASGRFGVDLFFAISGFLITTLLLRERQSTGCISLRRFYARRTLRIFPLYYAVLSIYVLAVFLQGRQLPGNWRFMSNLPYFLTYTSNWFVQPVAVFGFSWSLATEEQFYFAWPSVEKFFSGSAALLMVAFLGTITAFHFQWVHLMGFTQMVASSIALPICAGVLLAHALHDPRGFRIAWRLAGFRSASLLAFTIAAVVIGMRSDRFLIGAALTLVVAACVVREDHYLQRILSWPAVTSIGAVSYGMYMLHGLVYNALDIVGSRIGLHRHGIPMFVVAVLVTFLIAELSFRYYESFFLRLKKRFEQPAGRVLVRCAT